MTRADVAKLRPGDRVARVTSRGVERGAVARMFTRRGPGETSTLCAEVQIDDGPLVILASGRGSRWYRDPIPAPTPTTMES